MAVYKIKAVDVRTIEMKKSLYGITWVIYVIG